MDEKKWTNTDTAVIPREMNKIQWANTDMNQENRMRYEQILVVFASSTRLCNITMAHLYDVITALHDSRM